MIKDRILELRQAGWTYRQIEKELKCSKGTISYHCGKGQKEKVQKRQQDRSLKIKTYLRNHKEKIGCVDCKIKYPYYVLDFDHLQDKKFQLGNFHQVTYSLSKVKDEIAKCDVVCANCHRIRTFKRQSSS